MPEQYDFELGKDGLAAIVVGVDGSPSSVNAAAWASGLARRENALLVLVYVEQLSSLAYFTSLGAGSAASTAVEWVAELRGLAEQYFGGTGVRWELVHHRGDAAHGLEEVAEERRADCIVVGRSHHGGGLQGSVPKALIHDARRPVVVVP